LALALALALFGALQIVAFPETRAVAHPQGEWGYEALKVVFVASPRGPGNTFAGTQMIYSMDFGAADPSLKRITNTDGYTYDWATWGFGGSKIVFTATRLDSPELGENVYIMNADGSDRVQLTFGTWRSVQPKVAPDGNSVLFTARWHEFPNVALYALDLRTGEVRNLSSVASEDGARDSDPKWTPDGGRIVFANTRGEGEAPERPTQIFSMRPDGGERTRLTKDTYWNTDPSIAPDGRHVAISSYRGAGHPSPDNADGEFVVKRYGWNLTVLDIETGKEQILTEGLDCAARALNDPCVPNQGPAWVPQWSPDGKMIGFLTVLSPTLHGIYVVNADGSNARPLLLESDLAITWWDWTTARPTGNVPTFVAPPRLDVAAVLFGARAGKDKPVKLSTSSIDRSRERAIVLSDATITPELARWTPDKKHIVFTARHKVDRSNATTAAPGGGSRNVHYTLNDYTFVELPTADKDVAEEQVYLMDADGTNVRQLTTPWTEDRLEGMPADDARGNTDPDVSPDGRYVVFTNSSTTIPESYILRLDLVTGEVINLSAISSGAIAVADSKPRYSPDGMRIAFSSVIGAARQLFVMDADGTNVRQVTEDAYNNFDAAWSPDGRWLVFSSYRGEASLTDDETTPSKAIDLKNWFLGKVSLVTGEQQTLTAGGDSPVFRPVWSPDGARIAYISAGRSKIQIDISLMNADGTNAHPLVTLRTKEEFLDWR
jgi:Tol biopolymer transport system component